MEKFSKLMENTFKLRENGTTVKTEIIAGVTTFMTMAYILAVNPNILSSTGMDHGAVFTATALAAFLGTLLMALFANYPFALAPGMGLNAYFAYTVVLGYGYSWQAALTAVFAEGIIFIVLSLTNVREAIFNSIPVSLKSAVSVGIGLFIAFIGLQNAKIVLPNSSTVAGLYSLSSYNANLQSAATLNGTEYVAGTFNDVGITVLLACLYGLKYFLHILRLFDFIGIDIILFYQVFSHEDGWNAASFDLVRNAIDKPINLICFCNILAIDIFQVCAVFVNQFRHIHDLAGMHILYSCCCICVQKIDFLIAGKHQL